MSNKYYIKIEDAFGYATYSIYKKCWFFDKRISLISNRSEAYKSLMKLNEGAGE